MKIIDLSFCNKEYAQTNAYSTWKNNYSDWSYTPQKQQNIHSSATKTQFERLKKIETDRNSLKQMDYAQFRVKKPKYQNYSILHHHNNNNNNNINIRRDYNNNKRYDSNGKYNKSEFISK
jgi:hypothetical protein